MGRLLPELILGDSNRLLLPSSRAHTVIVFHLSCSVSSDRCDATLFHLPVERLAVKFLSVLFVDGDQSVFTCTGPSLAQCDEELGKGFIARSQKAFRQPAESVELGRDAVKSLECEFMD
jgi:hypothetical protein